MNTPISKPVQIVQPIISQQPARQQSNCQYRPLQNATSQAIPVAVSQSPIMQQNVNIMNINLPQMTPAKSGETLTNSQQFSQQINILPGTVLQLPDGRLVMPQQSNQTIYFQIPPSSGSSTYQNSSSQPLVHYQSVPSYISNTSTQISSSLPTIKQANCQITNSPISYPKPAPTSAAHTNSTITSQPISKSVSSMTPPNIVGNSPEDILSKIDSELSNLETLPNKSDYHQNHYKHLKEIRTQVEALILSKSNTCNNLNVAPSTSLQLKTATNVSHSPTVISRSPSNSSPIRPNFTPLRPRIDSRPSKRENGIDTKSEPILLSLNEERHQEAIQILSSLNLIPCEPVSNNVAVLVEFRLHSKRFLLKMSRQQKVELESILVKSPPQKQFDILQVIQQEQNVAYGGQSNSKLPSNDSQRADTLRRPIMESIADTSQSIAHNQSNSASRVSSNQLCHMQRIAPLQKPIHGNAETSPSVYVCPSVSSSPIRMICQKPTVVGPHPAVTPVTPTNTNPSPSGINPRIVRTVQPNNLSSSPSSLSEQKSSSTPRVNLKVAHLKRMLHADQQLALHPNTRVPFRNESNALLRLLCFHVFQDSNRTTDLSVLKADQILNKAETAILKKKSSFVDKVKSLLMKEELEGNQPTDSYYCDKIMLDLDHDLLEEEKLMNFQQKMSEEEKKDIPDLSVDNFPCDLLDNGDVVIDRGHSSLPDHNVTLDESLETNAMQDDQSSLVSDSIKTEDTGSIFVSNNTVKEECYASEIHEENDACPNKKPRLMVDNGDDSSSNVTQHQFSPLSNHISSSQHYFDEIMESLARDSPQSDVKHSEDPDVDAAIRSILF